VAKQTQTTYTFQVTFVAPNRASIQEARRFILDGLTTEMRARNPDNAFKDLDLTSVKVHLTNKEVKYG
jgi:hypothetical protein